jgi:hypothetical protein
MNKSPFQDRCYGWQNTLPANAIGFFSRLSAGDQSVLGGFFLTP